MLKPGLYEQIVNSQIRQELATISSARQCIAPLDEAEASRSLTQYISCVVQQGLDTVMERDKKLASQVALANRIVALVRQETGESAFDMLLVDDRAEQLLALLRDNDPALVLGKGADHVPRPETSIARSSLFTGAMHEPQMFSELKQETASADRIDMLVSFIRWSGLRLLIDALQAFTARNGQLRIITTSYMGATDIKAVEELAKLPNTQIKVSYDTKRTRLHAKTYVFHRESGFTTAYVGSSNLSNAAMSSGLEWNVKVTATDLPDTLQKISATFDSYWNAAEFETYREADRGRLFQALKSERTAGSGVSRRFFFDIQPYGYQQEILDRLHAERSVRGHFRNLVVAATGTGKTVVSAFDYMRFCRGNHNTVRLLFVAHREEILIQSRDTFQGVLKDPNFGDLFVGSYRPEAVDHLFVSIQTLNSQALTDKLPPDYYDYMVVDEFHHASAPSYEAMLIHFKPRILLGLTATPERLDGKDILDWFDGRIAAEIRLPEAIERKLLSPFQYFGVSDTIDLTELRWVKGGYDRTELSNLYTFSRAVAEKRADHIIRSMERYVTDLEEVRGLGFCVSVAHAGFMAERFNQAGIASLALTADSSDEERHAAKKQLVEGVFRFLFVVDIYNEGVDIPEVNTVLFLRPTESLTVFLQQLGRGLRLAEGKECLTVLDFIGIANHRYNFEDKFSAMLANTRHSVPHELEHGFVSVPKGCFIHLEKKAAEAVLVNIRQSFGRKNGLVSRIATFTEDSGLPLTLAHFVSHHHLDLRTVYAKDSFSRLCALAGVRDDFQEPVEAALTKAFPRFAMVDSRRWILFLLEILPKLADVDFDKLSDLDKRMLQMFYITIWQKAADDWNSDAVLDNLYALADSPVLLAELLDLLRFRYEQIDFVDESVDVGFDCPLDLHCTYTRDQLFVSLDEKNPANLREGVKWLPDKGIDVLLVTLNKSEKDYSPTTMYNDYSISDTLFHWQSQSTTAETSGTGQRYMHHRMRGSKVLLFVREFKDEMKVTAPYTFLGKVDYVQHQGTRPMNITWQLERPIPPKFQKKTNKLVVG